jgi:hypothetical protein
MSTYTPSITGALGLSPGSLRVTGIVRGGAVAKGTVLAFDLIRTYATNCIPGDAGSSLVIVRPVYAAAAAGIGVLGICRTAAADGGRVELTIEGMAEALVQGDLGSLASGSALYGVSGQAMLRDTTDLGRRSVGILREGLATATAQLALVDFNGVNGWGNADA